MLLRQELAKKYRRACDNGGKHLISVVWRAKVLFHWLIDRAHFASLLVLITAGSNKNLMASRIGIGSYTSVRSLGKQLWPFLRWLVCSLKGAEELLWNLRFPPSEPPPSLSFLRRFRGRGSTARSARLLSSLPGGLEVQRTWSGWCVPKVVLANQFCWMSRRVERSNYPKNHLQTPSFGKIPRQNATTTHPKKIHLGPTRALINMSPLDKAGCPVLQKVCVTCMRLRAGRSPLDR